MVLGGCKSTTLSVCCCMAVAQNHEARPAFDHWMSTSKQYRARVEKRERCEA